MNITWLAPLAIATTAALFLAPSPTPQRPAPQPVAGVDAGWLSPFVGKDFYLSPDWSVAVEKARTSAVPDGAAVFTLNGVGQDFAFFENDQDRVCVPLVALRVVLRK